MAELQLVRQGTAAGTRIPERGSSASVYGGSSADRYGGSSVDRGGVAGPRDRRVYTPPGKPKREERSVNSEKEADSQDKEEE